jgi:hypothetical protein
VNERERERASDRGRKTHEERQGQTERWREMREKQCKGSFRGEGREQERERETVFHKQIETSDIQKLSTLKLLKYGIHLPDHGDLKGEKGEKS